MRLLTFTWVTWACVGDLAAVFREVEATHLLAVEGAEDLGANVVRVIFFAVETGAGMRVQRH